MTSISLSKQVRHDLPDVLTLTAYSLAEARRLLQEYFINCFILDVNLPARDARRRQPPRRFRHRFHF